MATHDETAPSISSTADIPLETTNVDKLHINAIGLPAVMYFCFAGAAPIAAMFFNVPNMGSQGGASVPLVFLLSSIRVVLFGISIVYFARQLSSACGFFTSINHWLFID